jgi:hypothetical protein
MNKDHVAAHRKPVSPPAVQAAIIRITALVAIGGIAPSPTLSRPNGSPPTLSFGALQWPPCETSRLLPLPQFVFPLGGKLSDAAATPVGLRDRLGTPTDRALCANALAT